MRVYIYRKLKSLVFFIKHPKIIFLNNNLLALSQITQSDITKTANVKI